jgi:hypothetical protein
MFVPSDLALGNLPTYPRTAVPKRRPGEAVTEGDPFSWLRVLDDLARVCHDASWVG